MEQQPVGDLEFDTPVCSWLRPQGALDEPVVESAASS